MVKARRKSFFEFEEKNKRGLTKKSANPPGILIPGGFSDIGEVDESRYLAHFWLLF